MATLAEIAGLGNLTRGPDTVGAVSRGAVTGGQLAQLAGLQRQQRAAETVDRLLAEGAAAPGMRQAAIDEAARTGGALGASGLIDAFSALDAPEQERQAREAAILAQEMAGVTDQATWNAARARLAANPNVDITDLPEAFDPNLRTSIINGAREVADIFADVRSPEAQAQAIERAQAGRAQGGTTVINVGSSPLGKLISDRNALVAAGVAPDDPSLMALNRQIELAASEGLAEEEATEAAAETRQEAAQRASDVVDREVANITRLIDEARLPTTGLVGSFLSNIGGTAARDIAASLDTIRANVGFRQLQEMRDASPTGGALGQVTERELALLQSTLANLEQSQTQEQLMRNLGEIQRQFRVLTGGTPAERDALLSDTGSGSDLPEGTIIRNDETGERLILRNGEWVPFNG